MHYKIQNRFAEILLFIIVSSISASAQQTRTEIQNAPNPSEDSKQNSSLVPDVYSLEGQLDKVLILRFKYGADLLSGLERMAKENKIKNGVILAGTGSAIGYHYHAISNTSFPTKNIFVKDTASPSDIVSMNGYIINGRVHAHITFTDENKAYGGHLEPGTKVFTFAIVTIGVLKDGIDLSKIDDKNYR